MAILIASLLDVWIVLVSSSRICFTWGLRIVSILNAHFSLVVIDGWLLVMYLFFLNFHQSRGGSFPNRFIVLLICCYFSFISFMSVRNDGLFKLLNSLLWYKCFDCWINEYCILLIHFEQVYLGQLLNLRGDCFS